VSLSHSAPRTVGFLRSVDEVVDLKSVLAQLDLRTLLKARRRIGEQVSGVGKMGRRDAVAAWKSLSPEDRAFLKGLMSLRGLLGKAPAFDLGSSRFEGLAMPFGARISIALADGTVLEGEKLIPLGAPGDPERFSVPGEKFVREASGYLGRETAGRAVDALGRLERNTLAELREALSPSEDRRV
jgi:hypothetical protein